MFADLNINTIKRLNKKVSDEENEEIYKYIEARFGDFTRFFSSVEEIILFSKSVSRSISISTLKTIHSKSKVLEATKELGFTVKNISSMLSDSRSNLAANITGLLAFVAPMLDSDENPLCDANGVQYTRLSYLRAQGFSPGNISSMLSGSRSNLAANISGMLDFVAPVLDSDENPLCDAERAQYTRLSYLVAQGFSPGNISSMLSGSRSKLAANIAGLLDFLAPVLDSEKKPLCDAEGVQYTRLSYLKAQGFKPSNISSMLNGSGINLAANITGLLDFFTPVLDSEKKPLCDAEGVQYTRLSYLVAQGFMPENISSMLSGSCSKLAANITGLLDFVVPVLDSDENLLCDAEGVQYTRLSYLKAQGFKPSNISSMLNGSGTNLAANITSLRAFVAPVLDSDENPLCDAEGVQYTLLSYLVAQGFFPGNISSMLSCSGSKLAANIKSLLDFVAPVLDSDENPLCDANGEQYTLLSYLKAQGFKPSNISSMLNGSGTNLAANIKSLLAFVAPVLDSDERPLCDANGEQYTLLSYLVAQGFKPSNISSMLNGSGKNVATNITGLRAFVAPVLDSGETPLCDANGEQYTLLSYLKAQGFKPSNISSMLSCSRSKLAANIKSLLAFVAPVLDDNCRPLLDNQGNQYTFLEYARNKGYPTSAILANIKAIKKCSLPEKIKQIVNEVYKSSDINQEAPITDITGSRSSMVDNNLTFFSSAHNSNVYVPGGSFRPLLGSKRPLEVSQESTAKAFCSDDLRLETTFLDDTNLDAQALGALMGGGLASIENGDAVSPSPIVSSDPRSGRFLLGHNNFFMPAFSSEEDTPIERAMSPRSGTTQLLESSQGQPTAQGFEQGDPLLSNSADLSADFSIFAGW